MIASWVTAGLRPIVAVSGRLPATAEKALAVERSVVKLGYDVVAIANDSPSRNVNCDRTRATCSGARIPGGAESIRRSTRPNIDAFAPIASAKVSTTPATNVGSRRSMRAVCMKSRRKSVVIANGPPWSNWVEHTVSVGSRPGQTLGTIAQIRGIGCSKKDLLGFPRRRHPLTRLFFLARSSWTALEDQGIPKIPPILFQGIVQLSWRRDLNRSVQLSIAPTGIPR